jgi:Flp pilus assembly protein TadD
METSSYEAALKLLEEKIEEDPEDSRYHSALGIALAGLGRKKRGRSGRPESDRDPSHL